MPAIACRLPGCLAPVSTDVWREYLYREFWTHRRLLIITWDCTDITSCVRLESLQDGHYRLTLYSRYNSVVWNSLRRGTVGRYCWSAFLRDWRSCRQQENVISAPREKLSYCQGTVEPVVHPWSRLLYKFAELYETFGTVRPCCQTNCSSSLSSPPLLVAPPLVFCAACFYAFHFSFSIVRCGQPVRYSLDL